MMAMVDVVSQLGKGGPMAQVHGLGPRSAAVWRCSAFKFIGKR